MNEVDVVKVLEFEDFFPEETGFCLEETIRKFKRADLMRVAAIMSCNYGDAWFNDPEKPFFSFPNSPYIADIEFRWSRLCKQNRVGIETKLPFFTFRTAMELLRILYSIPECEYEDCLNKFGSEYLLFKCILAINTKILACNTSGATSVCEMMYFNMYITNEMSNFNISTAIRTQFTYANCLFQELATNPKCETLYKRFLERWKIKSWREYTNGLNAIVCQLYLMQKDNAKGTPIFDTDNIKADEGLLNKDFIDLLSVDVRDDIAYTENVDYKRFRECPLLRIGHHRYIPFSVQLLIEKIYGSVYFDLMNLYEDKSVDNLSFAEFYKKYLFEKHIFQRTMLNVVKDSDIIYPSKETVLSEEPSREDDSQPDFYIHEGRHVIMFECKAVKLKGNLRDTACFKDLKHELRIRFYNKKEEMDGKSRKHKNIGITQLTNFIAMSENGEYQWDKPHDVIYYPVLVLEEEKIIKEGLTCIMNGWYRDSLSDKCNLEKYRPLIVVSVDTLSLYADYFRENGFVHYFEKFYRETVKYRSMSEWWISELSDFNSFMRQECRGILNFDIEKFIRG